MDHDDVWVKYMGAALPGNAELVVLFSTVVAFPGALYLAQRGLQKFHLSLKNDQAGTLNAYFSDDRGLTWIQVDTAAIGIPAAGEDNVKEYGGLPSYRDWKLEWLNGATPQTVFRPNMHLTTKRSAIT